MSVDDADDAEASAAEREIGRYLRTRLEVAEARSHIEDLPAELAKAENADQRAWLEQQLASSSDVLAELDRYEAALSPELKSHNFDHASTIVQFALEDVEDAFAAHIEDGLPLADPVENEGGFCWLDVFADPIGFARVAYWGDDIERHLRSAETPTVRGSGGPLRGIVLEIGGWAAVESTWHLVGYQLVYQICFHGLDVAPSRRLLTQIRRVRSRMKQELLLVPDEIRAKREMPPPVPSDVSATTAERLAGDALHWARWDLKQANHNVPSKELAKLRRDAGDLKCTPTAFDKSCSLVRIYFLKGLRPRRGRGDDRVEGASEI